MRPKGRPYESLRMLTGPHLAVLGMVFSFMFTMVTLLPSLVTYVRERSNKDFGHTTRELDKFFVHLKALHIIIGAIAVGAILGVITQSWVLAMAITAISFFVPKIVLKVWKDIRSSQCEAQLMDALILIGNALRSGLDIATGIELVNTDMNPPISEEFGLVLNAYRLGSPLEGALLAMTDRIHSRTLETAIGAVIIQRETGGNLIKTFEQLVQTIREEEKLQKKTKAVSSQGRTQIAFLSVFPWCVFALFYFMSPEMMKPALESPWGQMTLIGLVVWEGIGIVVTKRIVTVDV